MACLAVGNNLGHPSEHASAAHDFIAREILNSAQIRASTRILALGGAVVSQEDFPASNLTALASDAAIDDLLRRERRALPSDRFDLIYSADWLNQSDDARAIVWLRSAIRLLRNHGRLLTASSPTYRDEQALTYLACRLPHESLTGHAVFRDDARSTVFLEIYAA